jgi:hypothetical protein
MGRSQYGEGKMPLIFPPFPSFPSFPSFLRRRVADLGPDVNNPPRRGLEDAPTDSV